MKQEKAAKKAAFSCFRSAGASTCAFRLNDHGSLQQLSLTKRRPKTTGFVAMTRLERQTAVRSYSEQSTVVQSWISEAYAAIPAIWQKTAVQHAAETEESSASEAAASTISARYSVRAWSSMAGWRISGASSA